MKEFEDNENFDIFKKGKQIKELISLTDANAIEYSNENSLETNLKDIFSNKNKFNNASLMTYNDRNKRNIDMEKKVKTNSFSFMNDKSSNMFKRMELNKSKEDLSSVSKLERENRKDNFESVRIKKDGSKNKNDYIIHNQRNNYYFNVIEIIINSFCKCCMSRELSIKNNIYKEANDILFNKLDIVLYIRNMILIDIINDSLYSDSKKDIINFLSRPLLR